MLGDVTVALTVDVINCDKAVYNPNPLIEQSRYYLFISKLVLTLHVAILSFSIDF